MRATVVWGALGQDPVVDERFQVHLAGVGEQEVFVPGA